MRTAIICKSLFGKAHTVMAEGGIAAAMGNVNSNDNWQVHFRDTMRGGKFLNNWRMAELHAKEAPDRVWELETYGALFDRTTDGRISQRNFGGHEYPRLAHVGDRTGLELIRTLQQKIVSLQQEDVRRDRRLRGAAARSSPSARSPSCSPSDGDRSPAPSATGASRAGSCVFEAPAVVLATGGIGKSFKVTVNSWEYTGDGHALALRAGAHADQHGVRPVPPDRHGLAALGQGHPRHRVGARRRRGAEATPRASASCSTTSPTCSRASTPRPRRRRDRWYKDPENNRRPPELLPRDEVARAINSEVKAGRGSPHGGVFLDVVHAGCRAEEIIKRLPSMHHQFKELADVDITKEPMEVGPTCHYVMGGVEVDPDTAAAAACRACSRPARCSGGMHGSNRLGGNSLSDLLVFGRRAGARRRGVRRRRSAAVRRPSTRRHRGRGGRRSRRSTPFEPATAARTRTRCTPELQQTMNDLVGIIRTADEIDAALERARRAARPGRGRRASRATGSSTRAGTSRSTCATCCWSASAWPGRRCMRKESRGGHTRDDYPAMDAASGASATSSACVADGDGGSTVQRAAACRPCAPTCSRCST